MSIRIIVAALALDTGDEPVVSRALQLARQHRSKLIFVHAVEDSLLHDPILPPPVGIAHLKRAIKQDAKERISQMIGFVDSQETVEITIKAGKPYEIVHETAKREQADLMVIGPGNARTVREKVLGSTADRLLRTVSVPVLVVRRLATGAYTNVSVATDFLGPSKAALQASASLAPGASIKLVHVVEIPLPFEQAMLKAGTSKEEIQAYRRGRAERARAQLHDFIHGVGDLSARPKLRVLHGNSGEGLVRLARSRQTELIALGLHNRNLLAQALIGSATRRVLQSAKSDILVVRSKDAL